VQAVLRNQLQPVDEALRLLPGPFVQSTQDLPAGVRPVSALPDSTGAAQMRKRVVLVYFIGGVTFAEISALRFVSRAEDSNHDILVATTKLINGRTLLEGVFEKVGLMAPQ
jgi:hypothetical protein